MNLLQGVRPLDYALATLMVALAAAIGYANVSVLADADLAHELDSQSVLLIPFFVVAAAPILWRRRAILASIAVSFVVVAASVPTFGWVTRCGFALPLSLALAYAVARFAGSKQNHLVGLVGILALQVVTLMKDASTGGLDAITLSVPAAALCYGIGLLVQTRSAKRPSEPTLSHEHVYA